MQASDIVQNQELLNEDFTKSAKVTPCLKALLEANKKVSTGTVLQLQSAINISVPKKSHEDSRVHFDPAKHSLKLSLTDGAFTVTAYLFDGHPVLSDQTLPGTKLRFLRDVPFKSKNLVLAKESVEVIGGHVKQLVDAWRISKDLDRTYHVWGSSVAKVTDSDSGPPKWREFDFKQGPIKISIPLKKDAAKKVEEEVKTTEFDEQRKANISRVTEQLGDLKINKTFGEGRQLMRKDVLDVMNEGFTEQVAENALMRFKTVKNALRHLRPKPAGEDDHKSVPKPVSTKKPNPAKLLSNDLSDEDDYAANAEYQKQKHNTTNTLFDFVKQAIPKSSENPQAPVKSFADTPPSQGAGRGQFNSYDSFNGGPAGPPQSARYGNYRGDGRNYNNSYNNDQSQSYYNSGRDSGPDDYGRGRGGGYSRRSLLVTIGGDRFNGNSRGRGRGRSSGGGGTRSRSFYRSRGSAL